MKQLTLIRHAESAWGTRNIDDIDRPLNHRGERDAPRIARHIRESGFSPDLILSSPATRAATTAEEIARGVGYDLENIVWKDQIYAAMIEDLVQLIWELDNQHAHVALVGHNPAFTELANQLQDTPIGSMPTGGVVSISFDSDRWSDVPDRCGSLLTFDSPKTIR